MNLSPITIKILSKIATEIPENAVRKKLENFFVISNIPKTSDQTSIDYTLLATTISRILLSPQDNIDDENSLRKVEAELKINEERYSEKDLRFHFMYLRDFRGIGCWKNDVCYGLNFCGYSNKPVSCVLLGTNGIGKSSFFNGIEKCIRGNTAACEKRCQNEKWFYKNIRSTTDSWYISIKTGSETYNVDSVNEKKGLIFNDIGRTAEPFFISESSIAIFEVKGESVVNYLRKKFGLIPLIDIEIILSFAEKELLSQFRAQTNVRDSKKSEQNNLTNKKDNLKSEMVVLNNELKKLKSELDKYNNQKRFSGMKNYFDQTLIVIKEKENKIKEKENKIKKIDEEIEEIENEIKKIDEEIKKKDINNNALNEYHNVIEKKIRDEYNIILSQTKDIMSKLFEDYLEKDEIWNEEKALVEIFKVANKGSNIRIFLNNFRFKMFLVCLNIAIAFETMRSTGINFPIVFDDVFDSSDFPNRKKTEDFFRKIFKMHDEIDGIKDKPLQIIFFTQDEVIAESIYRGITYDKKNHAILGRLFKTNELNENETILEDGNNKFVNMYDTIREG